MSTTIEPTVQNAVQTWNIDAAHTNVEFAVKHLMISTVKGRFGDVTGVLSGDLDDPSGFELNVDVDVASIDTRQSQRDAHLRSADFFNAEEFPTMKFVGKRVKGDVREEFTLIGELTIRDVTREIELQVTNEGSVRDPWGGSRVGFSAKGKIDRRDYGLTYNQALEAGGWVVGDEVKISVDVELTAG
jgi:polyisoprenoid-binding protein YceI